MTPGEKALNTAAAAFPDKLLVMHANADGEYVRRWIPELRHVDGPAVHEPWSLEDGYAHGYPERIVDHAHERRDALSRLDEIKELAL